MSCLQIFWMFHLCISNQCQTLSNQTCSKSMFSKNKFMYMYTSLKLEYFICKLPKLKISIFSCRIMLKWRVRFGRRLRLVTSNQCLRLQNSYTRNCSTWPASTSEMVKYDIVAASMTCLHKRTAAFSRNSPLNHQTTGLELHFQLASLFNLRRWLAFTSGLSKYLIKLHLWPTVTPENIIDGG